MGGRGEALVIAARTAKKILKAIYKKVVAKEGKEAARKEVGEALGKDERLGEAIAHGVHRPLAKRVRRIEIKRFLEVGKSFVSRTKEGVGRPDKPNFENFLRRTGEKLEKGYERKPGEHGPRYIFKLEGDTIEVMIARHGRDLSKKEFDEFFRWITTSKQLPNLLQDLMLLNREATWADIARIVRQKYNTSKLRVLVEFSEQFRGQDRAATEINRTLGELRTSLAA